MSFASKGNVATPAETVTRPDRLGIDRRKSPSSTAHSAARSRFPSACPARPASPVGPDADGLPSAAVGSPSRADAGAVAYVETIDGGGTPRWGVGVDPNIVTASLRAVLSALARRSL